MNEDTGIINRIYLENFVTYDRVVIKPGRNLNVIIGPNGTGKSTIVCAIVIGLGGKAKVIGRAPNVGDYIKTGCKRARIEIELQDSNNKSIIIERSFTKDSKTTWKLNGKEVHHKEIQEIIKGLNIQVDNLCQFLPQDKVQDFSKMNSQDLLENTERSVGDPKLLEYHVKLKDYRKQGIDFEQTMANKTRLLESELHKYEGMKEVVGSIKERKAIKNKIRVLKQKRAWICYDLSRKQLCEAKHLRDNAARDMKKLDDKVRPVKQKLAKLECDINELKKRAKINNDQLSSKTSNIARLKEEIESKERDIRDIEANCEHKIRMEENRDKDITLVVQQKNKLDNDLQVFIDDVGTEVTLATELRRVSHELEQKRSQLETLTKEIIARRAKLDNIDSTISILSAEMEAVKDVDAKRLELLRQRSADAHRGVLWLRENRDKFVSVIHEPIMLTIDVKDTIYAKYFENVISYRDLIAFVCEDKTDMNRLLTHLRSELKLKINVVHSDPNKDVRMAPNISLDRIKQFGFQHYLLSLIEAPDTIIKYLVTMNRIHNIPVGTDAVEDNVDRIPDSLRLYFSQNNSFAVGVSKYTGAKSTRMSQVIGNGSLSVVQDANKLQELKKKLGMLNADKDIIMEEVKSIEIARKTANEALETDKSTRQNCQRNLQTIQGLNSKINVAKRRIQELQSSRTSADDIKTVAAHDIQRILKSQIQDYVQYNSIQLDCFRLKTTIDQIKIELDSHKRKFVLKSNESQKLIDLCTLAEQTYKKHESELAPLKKEAERLYQAAMTSTNNVSPENPDFKSINAAFSKLPVKIEDIESALEIAQARVYCLEENSDGEQILVNYEKTKKNVEKLKNEINEIEIEHSRMKELLEEIGDLWLTPVKDLVERINDNFSSYFSMMGCAGEITLKQPSNLLNYDAYGIMIRVKFRDSDELQELTRQRQSGGERAVTTAVYMIALQQFCRVPFRCVDEINQGMDAVNERRIFELIVNMTGRENSSQYFLLTPKLLSDLEYGTHVTLHCVFNGPFMAPTETLDTARYCENLRTRSSYRR